jgi:hypothetical protein
MIPHVLASNGDLALKNSVHLPKQKSLGLRKARDTSGEVAEDGILPGEFTKHSRYCSDLFNWSFDY